MIWQGFVQLDVGRLRHRPPAYDLLTAIARTITAAGLLKRPDRTQVVRPVNPESPQVILNDEHGHLAFRLQDDWSVDAGLPVHSMRSLLPFENTTRPEEELLERLPRNWVKLGHSRWDRQPKRDTRHTAYFDRRLPVVLLLEPTQLFQLLLQGSVRKQFFQEYTERDFEVFFRTRRGISGGRQVEGRGIGDERFLLFQEEHGKIEGQLANRWGRHKAE
jgi:hypothetical protein